MRQFEAEIDLGGPIMTVENDNNMQDSLFRKRCSDSAKKASFL